MNNDRLFRSIPPSQLPVTTADVREHLVISDVSQDAYLERLVAAATAMIDGPDGIGIALMPQTYEMVVDGLTSPIRIPIYPVRTVEGIAWEDENGSHSTTTEFRLIKSTGTVHHDLSASALPDSVIVTFTAGYDVVPADLRHAVLMLVGHLYENREATASTKLERVPFAVESILSRYRVA